MEEAAKKIGVPPSKYTAWEMGEDLPTYKQLENLAEKVYKRPIVILMLDEPPEEDGIEKDFRSLSNAQITDLSPEVRLALRKAKRYQLILAETGSAIPARYESFSMTNGEDPAKAAARFRDFVGLMLATQKSWRSDDAYRRFQSVIESIGIYVFKMKLPMPQVRAFCLTGLFPVIVLNTDDSENGRIFSLFHETCHILLNENDVFNDDEKASSKRYADIEAFCNRFAAAFLVPDDSFAAEIKRVPVQKDKVTDQEIQRLAKMYNVSAEVIARKFLLRRLMSEESFWKKKRLWDAAARAAKKKKNERLKGDDGGMDQGIKVLYAKGRPYVSSVINAYDQGMISSADLSNYLETKVTNLPKINERLNF
jgi:Zn-dependent peptidase ImmA (M78 family)